MPLSYRGKVFCNTSVTVACRIEDIPTAFGQPGVPFTQSDFSVINFTVTDTTTGAVVSNNGTTYNALPLTVANVIFDVLQGWDQDSLGYNFRLTISGDAFPQPLREYEIAIRWAMTDGRTGAACFIAKTEDPGLN